MINKRFSNYATFSTEFKGAPDGWCDLQQVNFLVGENSSGKTSYLQLLDLLDSHQFLLFNTILGEQEGLSTAFDVISRKNAANSLTIGLAHSELRKSEEDEAKDKPTSDEADRDFKTRLFGKLVTYKAVNNNLQITKITQVAGDFLVSMMRRGNALYVRLDDISEGQDFDTLKIRLFTVHSSTKGYKKEQNFSFPEDDEGISWISATAHIISTKLSHIKHAANQSIGLPSALRAFQYGPMRRKPNRLHSGGKREHSPTGDHVPYIMRDFWKEGVKSSARIIAFGKESGLFDGISVATISTKINDKPFAVQIAKNGKFYYVDELGFGLSQILPIVADIQFSGSSVGFLIQQPELHLHPRAQAAFGELLFYAAQDGHFFAVETHSDFLLDRFRLVQKKSNESASAQILFFEPTEGAAGNSVHRISIERGKVVGAPPQYRAFFLAEKLEQFDLL